jgi:hypothetical protein
VRDYARWIFLQTVSREVPNVLRTLADVPAEITVAGWALDDTPHEATLTAWADRWHLTAPWCLAYAGATWRFWQRHPAAQHTYWVDRDDLTGVWLESEQGPSARRPLKDPQHVTWCAWYQCCEHQHSYASIAQASGVPDVQTVHAAIQGVARLIDLQLRSTRRGRPRKPIS